MRLEGKTRAPPLWIGIESGVLPENGRFVDRAIVVAKTSGGRNTASALSGGVTFPDDQVEIARQRGFDTTTVGQVMAENNIVADAKDPHLSLTGIPRQDYIEIALANLISTLRQRALLPKP